MAQAYVLMKVNDTDDSPKFDLITNSLTLYVWEDQAQCRGTLVSASVLD